MNRNTLLTLAKPLLATAALLALTGGVATRATAGTIGLSLSGMCGTEFDCRRDGYYQAGAAGLFIGNYNNLGNEVRRRRHNWIWEDMLMEIDDNTGDATITGSMVTAISNQNSQRFGTTLGVEIQLTGMSLYGDAFSGETEPYRDMVNDLFANGEVGGYRNTQDIDALQWSSLSMSFTHESGFNRPGTDANGNPNPDEIDWIGGNDDDIPLTGWQGMADNRYHCRGCVAELEMRDDGNGGKELHFGSWFSNPTGDYRYNFADTKSKAEWLYHDEPTAKVPEPSLLLGFLAAVGLGAWSKKQRNA